jgi:hypothetical protein
MGSLAVNECCDVSPWIARKLVRWSAHRRYAPSSRAEVRAEECAAYIDDRPGKLFKLLTALIFATKAVVSRKVAPAVAPPNPLGWPTTLTVPVHAAEPEDEWASADWDTLADAVAVRPYAWTRGRTRPVYDLAVETLVSTIDHGQDGALTCVEHRSVARLCHEPRSVAEVAALLSLPLGVARVVLSDMADIGLVMVHQTAGPVGCLFPTGHSNWELHLRLAQQRLDRRTLTVEQAARDLLKVLGRDDPAGDSPERQVLLRDLLVEIEDRQERWRN